MIVGVPKEALPGEKRVALIPASLAFMTKSGLDVIIEAGAGHEAGFPDKEYQEAGATIASDRAEVFAKADIIVQIHGPSAALHNESQDLELLRKGQFLIGFLDALTEGPRVQTLAATGVQAFAMELVPRITRAQSMDALSSMATVAGYKAVLIASCRLPRMFPMLMTAAGTIKPARVLVIGAGVAGLQAIATAKRLGSVVESYDVRPDVKEQVESLGAKFVELDLDTETAEDSGGYAKAMGEEFYQRQREQLGLVVAASDVVICTAAIPGRASPLLVTEAAVQAMAPGSLIVDLAAERGGNCELTEADKLVVKHDVTIIGPTDIVSTVPYHASQMYAKNICAVLKHLVEDGVLKVDLEDEITGGSVVCSEGQIVHARVKEFIEKASAAGAEN